MVLVLGVGQDLEKDLHFDAPLVLAVQHSHGLDGFWDGPSSTDEDSVNVEGKGKRGR